MSADLGRMEIAILTIFKYRRYENFKDNTGASPI